MSNALKHGLLSELPVVDGQETPEAWLAHRQAFYDDLQPRGAVQEVVVERIALTLWKMARLARAEVAAAQRTQREKLAGVTIFKHPSLTRMITAEEARAELALLDPLHDYLSKFPTAAGNQHQSTSAASAPIDSASTSAPADSGPHFALPTSN